LAGFEPATFGSSGKHTNHYTTKTTVLGDTDLFIYRLLSEALQLRALRGVTVNDKFEYGNGRDLFQGITPAFVWKEPKKISTTMAYLWT
jgi:hypothetical protein